LPQTLGSEQSAALHDRLVAEIEDLSSTENAAFWARRALSKK